MFLYVNQGQDKNSLFIFSFLLSFFPFLFCFMSLSLSFCVFFLSCNLSISTQIYTFTKLSALPPYSCCNLGRSFLVDRRFVFLELNFPAFAQLFASQGPTLIDSELITESIPNHSSASSSSSHNEPSLTSTTSSSSSSLDEAVPALKLMLFDAISVNG